MFLFLFYSSFPDVFINNIFTNIPIRVYNHIGDSFMEKKNCCKKTIREEETKKDLINRLNRISGQMNGVKKMVEEDSNCNDILIQLKAVENSIKSLSNQLLENHLHSCITRDLKNEKLETIDEVVDLFKRFNR